ncbi:MAG: STAS domain-containing protein, partial [Gaiella sp.]
RRPGRPDEDEDYGFRDTSRHRGLETYPGLLIYRFDQEVFFANARHFRDALRRAIDAQPSPVREVLVDCAAITHVDTTGLDMLRELHRELSVEEIFLCLARLKSPVRDSLERAGLLDQLGPDATPPTLHHGVAAYRRRSGDTR